MDRDPDFMAMLGGVRDEAQTAAYLERNLNHWSDHGFGLWMLRESVDHRFAGRAVLRHLLVEGTDEVEVGYGFYPEFWGRGLAPEIATACLHFARTELRLASIVAITLPANLRSQRVMTRVGLVYERDLTHEGLRHVLFRSRPG
jgi:ribosomal-protein-alanine N-acetyltransferase